jgi:peptide/nickel transport system substrate-binding protein
MDRPLRDPVRPQHDRHSQDLTRNRLPAFAALAGLLVALAGCGGGSTESVTPGTPPTPAGTLGIAIPAVPDTFDPLLSTTTADQLVAGQVYEPLTRALSGPYGETGRKPGLALSAKPGAHSTIWRMRLRTGVRFQDGARFNASAVLKNAERWRTTPEGQALVPGLVAADAPRPDLVRFFFAAPDPDLVHQLDSVRLGVVSPRVLRSPPALARLANGLPAGTGPFEVHDHDAERVLLARNPRWWGTRHDLGPGVELVDLRFAAGADRRLSMLRHGTVQVAEGLAPAQVPELRRDPLLTDQAGAAGTRIGVVRSVRDLRPGRGVPVLSRAWLTTVGTGSGTP